jgi:Rrf2 family protein
MLHALVRAGIVSSTRGPAGGFMLAIDPDVLTVADIADCFDDERSTGHCLLGARPCNPSTPCAAHARWNAMHVALRAPLVNTTIASLVAGDDADPRRTTRNPRKPRP